MNIIRSNPWGFRIHSPFAYVLVSKVIYGNIFYVNKNDIFVRTPGRGEIRRLNRIWRIIRFLNPERVTMVGDNDLITESARKFHFQIKTMAEKKEMHQQEILSSDFVIWNEAPELTGQVRMLPSGITTWLLTDVKSREMKKFFLFLRKSEAVTLTFEAGKCGIIIFNRKYQKQDYVIRSFF